MPRKETILRVFASSPSDVGEERILLEEVIQELNLTWSKDLSIRLELVRWETHAYPDIGTDAQAVINEQIGDDYDIFLGVLGTHFGTPTPRSGSGTQEEFQNALRRWRRDSAQLSIMFYFKDTPVAPSELDVDQLRLVTEFRNELKNEGVLFWPYSNRDDFARLLRMHLSRHVQEWRQKAITGQGLTAEPTVRSRPASAPHLAEPDLNVDEELGFIDLLEIGLEKSNTVKEVLQNMHDAMETLTQRMNERTAETEQVQKGGDFHANLPQVRRIFNRAGADMDQFALRMEKELPIFAESYSTTIDVFVRAASMARGFAPDDIGMVDDAINGVAVLETVLGQAKGAVAFFRYTVDRLPKMTAMVNRARRRTVSVLNRLENEIGNAIVLTGAARATFLELRGADAQSGRPTEHTDQ